MKECAELTEVSMRCRNEDDARAVVMRCPVCDGVMRLVNVERSIVALPSDMERHTIQCFVCDFAMSRVFLREHEV